MKTDLDPAIIERAAAALVVRLIHDCGVDWCRHDLMAVQTNFGREVRAALQSAIPEAVEEERNSCAFIAEGFDAACNSKANRLFVEAGVMYLVCQRDLAIGAAIRARSAEQKGEGNG